MGGLEPLVVAGVNRAALLNQWWRTQVWVARRLMVAKLVPQTMGKTHHAAGRRVTPEPKSAHSTSVQQLSPYAWIMYTTIITATARAQLLLRRLR